jgi:hypothetical protein
LIGHSSELTTSEEEIFSFYPMGPRRLFVKFHRFLDDGEAQWDEIRQILWTHLHQRGWQVSRVIQENHRIVELPLTCALTRTHGKVISLAGLLHGPGGSSIPQIVGLVEKITSASFRLGEVQHIVKEYRQHFEARVQPYLSMNRLSQLGVSPFFHRWLKSQDSGFLHRYFSMKLSRWDRVRLRMMFMLWKIKHVSRPQVWEKKPRYQCQFSK